MLEARIQNGKQLLGRCPDHIIVAIPRREGVQNLEVSDNVIDHQGRVCKVVGIYCLGEDANGKLYAGLDINSGNGVIRKQSYKQDRLVRTIPLLRLYTHAELDDIEAYLNSEVDNDR